MNFKWILAVVLLGVGAYFGVTSFRRSVTPYIPFNEARRSTGMVQVNGMLAEKNYFDQATSIVAIGHYRADHFEAEQLLVKCPSKYQAEAEKAQRHAS